MTDTVARAQLKALEDYIHNSTQAFNLVTNLAREAGNLVDEADRVHAASLLSNYVLNTSETLAGTAFDAWESLVRKIATTDIVQAERLASYTYRKFETAENDRPDSFFYHGVRNLYRELNTIISRNRAAHCAIFSDVSLPVSDEPSEETQRFYASLTLKSTQPKTP